MTSRNVDDGAGHGTASTPGASESEHRDSPPSSSQTLLERAEAAERERDGARQQAESWEASFYAAESSLTTLQARNAELEEALREGWLPIVLCPTDGMDRVLLLPDGREVVGAYHNPGVWRTQALIEHEYDQPIYEKTGGVLPSHSYRPAREPKVVGYERRKHVTTVYGRLPEGVYPTHFRPNDTVHGVASQALRNPSKPSEEQP